MPEGPLPGPHAEDWTFLSLSIALLLLSLHNFFLVSNKLVGPLFLFGTCFLGALYRVIRKFREKQEKTGEEIFKLTHGAEFPLNKTKLLGWGLVSALLFSGGLFYFEIPILWRVLTLALLGYVVVMTLCIATGCIANQTLNFITTVLNTVRQVNDSKYRGWPLKRLSSVFVTDIPLWGFNCET